MQRLFSINKLQGYLRQDRFFLENTDDGDMIVSVKNDTGDLIFLGLDAREPQRAVALNGSLQGVPADVAGSARLFCKTAAKAASSLGYERMELETALDALGRSVEPKGFFDQEHALEPEQDQVSQQPEQPTLPEFADFFVPLQESMLDYVLQKCHKDALNRVHLSWKRGRKEVVMLTGPSGAGKTSLAEFFAANTRRPLFIQDMGPMESALEFFGANRTVNTPTGIMVEWDWSDTVRALRTKNAVVLLDEFTRLYAAHTNGLLPLFDHRGRIRLPGMNEPVEVADGVTFFLTANIGSEFTGTFRMDAAMMERVTTHLQVDYLEADVEVGVIRGKSGCKEQDAERLVKVAAQIRELAGGARPELSMAVSTRALICAGDKMAVGADLKAAVRDTFLYRFPEDERQTVLSLVQKQG